MQQKDKFIKNVKQYSRIAIALSICFLLAHERARSAPRANSNEWNIVSANRAKYRQ